MNRKESARERECDAGRWYIGIKGTYKLAAQQQKYEQRRVYEEEEEEKTFCKR